MTSLNFLKPGGFFVGLFSFKRVRVIVFAIMVLVSAKADAQIHPLLPEYGDVLVTYACHAKTLWHDKAEGGYWGDGFNAKNQNGAVRGNCSTLLTYAMLVRALDDGWLKKEDIRTLRKAGLNRHEMIKYIRLNLAYLAAHHKSAASPASPAWGYDWQSSLWMQSLGMGALLSWKELGNELKTDIKRVAAAEAGWVASRLPRSESPGNTGAEENAWDTGAPAVALAMMPEESSASLWMQTLTTYAANTYSHPEDKYRTGKIAELVSTKNINRDWTLLNHNFFHPDYAQVSGMHLGEAWLILKLGDGVHGTSLADTFEPFARHNVEEVWNLVLRPLLLPTGEFAFPAGNDWTYHCSTNQGYFAYIATAFGSYDAAEAEARGLQHVKNRREVSPSGRLLGDSNLEWWWEPLVCKRSITAMLHHMMRPDVQPKQPEFEATVDGLTTTALYPDAKIWMTRTPQYFFSLSFGKPSLGYFVPLSGKGESAPYTTLPLKGGFLPDGDWEYRPARQSEAAVGYGGIFRSDDRLIAGIACLENSVVVLSRDGFGAISVENDSLTDPGRTIISSEGSKVIPSLQKSDDVTFRGPWINIDENLGLISNASFDWKPAGGWNQRSVGSDRVKPRTKKGAWQLLKATAEESKMTANSFTVEEITSGILAVVQDGPTGPKYSIQLTDDDFKISKH